MRYVLESEKYPGNYLVFKHGSPPHVVDLKSAQKFDNVPKALNRISTIPKNLSIYAPWKVTSVDERVGFVQQNKSLVEIGDYKKKIDDSILPIKEILGNRKPLEKQLKELELISQDLDHYIEFNKLNVTSGYWAYKIRKVIREKRRSIKEDLYYIDYLQTASLPQIVNGEGRPNPDNQKYQIRSDIGQEFFNQKYILHQCTMKGSMKLELYKMIIKI